MYKYRWLVSWDCGRARFLSNTDTGTSFFVFTVVPMSTTFWGTLMTDYRDTFIIQLYVYAAHYRKLLDAIMDMVYLLKTISFCLELSLEVLDRILMAKKNEGLLTDSWINGVVRYMLIQEVKPTHYRFNGSNLRTLWRILLRVSLNTVYKNLNCLLACSIYVVSFRVL